MEGRWKRFHMLNKVAYCLTTRIMEDSKLLSVNIALRSLVVKTSAFPCINQRLHRIYTRIYFLWSFWSVHHWYIMRCLIMLCVYLSEDIQITHQPKHKKKTYQFYLFLTYQSRQSGRNEYIYEHL